MTAQTTSQANPQPKVNLRLFGVLLGMVAFGLVALIPYGLTLSVQTFSPEMLPQLAVQFVGQIVL